MHVRIANREDPDQTAYLLFQKQSDLGLRCFSMPFWQSAIVRNFRLFTVYCSSKICGYYVVNFVNFEAEYAFPLSVHLSLTFLCLKYLWKCACQGLRILTLIPHEKQLTGIFLSYLSFWSYTPLKNKDMQILLA